MWHRSPAPTKSPILHRLVLLLSLHDPYHLLLSHCRIILFIIHCCSSLCTVYYRVLGCKSLKCDSSRHARIGLRYSDEGWTLPSLLLHSLSIIFHYSPFSTLSFSTTSASTFLYFIIPTSSITFSTARLNTFTFTHPTIVSCTSPP